MQNTPNQNSRSPPPSGGIITRAQSVAVNDTAQPSLTSGFGTIITKEHDLLSATAESFGHVSGEHAAEIERILQHQQARLGANIALLEQRYEALPNPERFVHWQGRAAPPAKARITPREESELLPTLIALHTRLLTDIKALIGCGHDGQRGELILTEVGRNHEEMAWMLTALLKEDATVPHLAEMDLPPEKGSAVQAQHTWDNEGGTVPPDS